MSKNRCLYCYGELAEDEFEFHSKCSRKIFGKPVPPLLNYTNGHMLELAENIIKNQITVTGVQPKLSLGLSKLSKKGHPQKLTIMGVLGNYILKPPSEIYPLLPELEDLTMHLATIAGIETVPHSLIRLKSGELSYLTKRIDREGNKKLHMEDMCQLTGRLTESKYRGSYEQIGKVLAKHSTTPGLDIVNFFEQVVFSFLTGNNDMHLKNFSLFKNPKSGYRLSPAYDMVASALVMEDDDELALTLNGKKKKIGRKDFEMAMSHFDIGQKATDNIFNRFSKAIPGWHEFIEISFLSDEMKQAYHAMVDNRIKQIEINT